MPVLTLKLAAPVPVGTCLAETSHLVVNGQPTTEGSDVGITQAACRQQVAGLP